MIFEIRMKVTVQEEFQFIVELSAYYHGFKTARVRHTNHTMRTLSWSSNGLEISVAQGLRNIDMKRIRTSGAENQLIDGFV